MSDYELLPPICIRLAGRPFDHLEQLGLKETLVLARRLLSADDDVEAAAKRALEALRANPEALVGPARNKVGQALGLKLELPPADCALSEVAQYRQIFAARKDLLDTLQRTLEAEFQAARGVLLSWVPEDVKPFAVFSSDEMNERVDQAIAKGADKSFDRRARERERHLLLYLQRVCAKTDTVSEFGPTAWGRVDLSSADALQFSAKPGIARRDVYLEKWVVDGVAAAMNSDPEVRPELSPRPHPLGRIDGERFIREDTGAERTLSAEERSLALACDGKTPAHALGRMELLSALSESGVVVWRVEPIALDPHRLETLRTEVAAFREGAARARWLEVIDQLLGAAKEFGAATAPNERFAKMQRAREVLGQQKVSAKEGRELYAANNPIGEDCAREVQFVVGRGPAEALTGDAAPWLDLWCDTFAYAATKWGERLIPLYKTARRSNGKVLLPTFMAHCRDSGFPISGQSFGQVAGAAVGEVKALFKEQLASRPYAEEWELTAEDCHIVRRKLKFQPFAELIYPSLDLMLAAPSRDAVAKGDYQWIISELHIGNVMQTHALNWACPDFKWLGEAQRRAVCNTPFFNYEVGGADVNVHTTMRPYDVVPDLWTWVSPNKARADYPQLPPTRAEVVLDEGASDLRVRSLEDGRDLGSLVRHWGVATNGMHPFLFVVRPHMPRLRMGRVVVQRQFWNVALHDLLGGPFQGVSPRLVAAVEQLRARLSLPRFIFARPAAHPDPSQGRASQDKDVKPIFVDLESYHSLDVFHHALGKHGQMEVSEMLPGPSQMIWREDSGRYCYELRTLIGPR